MRKTYTPDRLTRADKLAQKIIAKVEELFVKKDGNKVLSTNDYTTAEKKKLSGIKDGATKTAKSETNGNILIDGAENVVYTHPDSTAGAKTAGLYNITTDKFGHVTAATAVVKGDITKLGIPENDTVYTHPESGVGAKAEGLYKITTDTEGHVTGATEVVKGDITKLGIPGESGETYEDATTTTHGLMSAEDKKKLDEITANMETSPFRGLIHDSDEMQTVFSGAIQPGDWWIVTFYHKTASCFGSEIGSGSIIIARKAKEATAVSFAWVDNFGSYATILNSIYALYYKVDKAVPHDAIFVPSNGSEGQVLKWGASGPEWADA